MCGKRLKYIKNGFNMLNKYIKNGFNMLERADEFEKRLKYVGNG